MHDLSRTVRERTTRGRGLLAGRTAIVTGGGAGIGAAIAERYRQEGARVAVVDIAAPPPAARTGRRSVRVTGDVTRREEVSRLFDEIEARLGSADILVNNVGAGGSPARLLVDLDEEHWDGSMAHNLKSTFLCTQAFARRRIAAGGGGTVVNMSSLSGKVGTPLMGMYAVAKAGVIRLTDVFARELAPHAITVNCICPSVVATPLSQRIMERHPQLFERAFDLGEGGDVEQRLAERIPLGRLARVEDVAGVAAFLASADAAYITGQAINCNGGLITH